jgi:hypothetical protein
MGKDSQPKGGARIACEGCLHLGSQRTSLDTYKFEAGRMVARSTLLSLCRGLVTIEEESRLVRLVRE